MGKHVVSKGGVFVYMLRIFFFTHMCPVSTHVRFYVQTWKSMLAYNHVLLITLDGFVDDIQRMLWLSDSWFLLRGDCTQSVWLDSKSYRCESFVWMGDSFLGKHSFLMLYCWNSLILWHFILMLYLYHVYEYCKFIILVCDSANSSLFFPLYIKLLLSLRFELRTSYKMRVNATRPNGHFRYTLLVYSLTT